jgi:colicin import membrane protein
MLPTPSVFTQQQQLDACLWDRDFDDMKKEMQRLEMWDYLSYVGKWQAMRTEMKLSMIRKGDKAQIKRWTKLEREGQIREARKKVIHNHMVQDAEGVLRRASEREAAIRAWDDHRDRLKAEEDAEAARKRAVAERERKARKAAAEREREKRRAQELAKAQKLKEAEQKKLVAEQRKKDEARKRAVQAANKQAAIKAQKLAKRNYQMNVG